MKKFIFTLIAATLIFSGCDKFKQFTVTVNLDNAENQKVYLCLTENGKDYCIDSTVIVNKTGVMKADPFYPETTYSIKFNPKDNCGIFPFFTENQNTTITGDRNDMQHWTVKGCPAMDILMAHHEESMKLYEEPILALYAQMEDAYQTGDTLMVPEINTKLQSLQKGYFNYQADFIRSHHDSYIGHYMLNEFKEDFDFELVQELFDDLTGDSEYRNHVMRYIERMRNGGEDIPWDESFLLGD